MAQVGEQNGIFAHRRCCNNFVNGTVSAVPNRTKGGMTVSCRLQRVAIAGAASALVHSGCLLPACSAQSTGASSHAGAGDSTFFGMSTNVAILVMVLISVVVIGIMLFVLQRQCKARKRSRLVSQVMEARRRGSTNTNDYVAPIVTLVSEEDENESDVNTQELVGGATSAGVVGCRSNVCEAGGGGGGWSDAALLQRNPLEASTGSASLGGLADLDTPDAAAVRSSSARVAHWLSHSVVPPPPLESPQFVTLRASSFLGVRPSDGAANGRPPADAYVRSTRPASCLVVNRDNGALQLSYSLPPVNAANDRNETRSPQSATSDPFR